MQHQIDIIRAKRNWGILNHRRGMSDGRKARAYKVAAIATAILAPVVIIGTILTKP